MLACPATPGPDGGTGGGGGSPTTTDVTADIAASTTWTKDKVYVLKQLTYVNAGATLTIEPGTTIAGDAAAALIISRDAKLIAAGTAAAPIVFTSSLPAGQRGSVQGDWGGLVFLGRATINTMGGENNAEGLADDPKNKYGGTDDAYDCGTLKYVRVEFAGRPLSANNELNGVTLNACGSATTVDFLQVHRGVDDGVEIFGGKVNLKHVVITGSDDDGLDWDKGWTGKAQFVIAAQIAGRGNHGIEADNDATNADLMPRSAPTLFNVTLVGRNPDSAASEGPSRGMILRAGTAGSLNNVVVTNFTDKGLLVDGNPSKNQWTMGALSVKNSIFFQNPTMGVTDYISSPRPDGGVTDNMFNEPTELAAPSLNNRFDIDPKLAAATSVTAPIFKPLSDSPALMGGAVPPSDGFFDATATFVGAIGADDWTTGWTAYPEN
ncbi:MAG: hypothetical protein JNM17_31910 [Archangium sp.]|nr:hypothetical protein [Archangium sp.]